MTIIYSRLTRSKLHLVTVGFNRLAPSSHTVNRPKFGPQTLGVITRSGDESFTSRGPITNEGTTPKEVGIEQDQISARHRGALKAPGWQESSAGTGKGSAQRNNQTQSCEAGPEEARIFSRRWLLAGHLRH